MDAISVDREIRNIKRLRVNLSVGRNDKKFAELVKIDVRRRENGLVQILPGSCEIVMPGQNVHRENGRRGREYR
ncbi:MAG: hypothetical protein DME35_09070 [Verrucomicrobia bacterium]|nr:MAG: hypothetical protein DME35_09070 [Verrucomicrobiota bacterium]